MSPHLVRSSLSAQRQDTRKSQRAALINNGGQTSSLIVSGQDSASEGSTGVKTYKMNTAKNSLHTQYALFTIIFTLYCVPVPGKLD